jgi:hypothetical protein
MSLINVTNGLPRLHHVDDPMACTWSNTANTEVGKFYAFLTNRVTNYLPLFRNVLVDGQPSNAKYVEWAKAPAGGVIHLAVSNGIYFDYNDGALPAFRDLFSAAIDTLIAEGRGEVQVKFGVHLRVWTHLARDDAQGLLSLINHIIDREGLVGGAADDLEPLDTPSGSPHWLDYPDGAGSVILPPAP